MSRIQRSCLYTILLLGMLMAGACVNAPAATPAPTPPAAAAAAPATAAPAPTTPLTSTTASTTAAPTVSGTDALSGTATAPISGTAAAGEGKTFVNPILTSDFPDPDVNQVGPATFWSYATNAAGKHVQAASSTDLVNWQLYLYDTLPVLPEWAQPGGMFVWAPDVIQIGQRYVMYYTARSQQYDKQCIGVATGDKPEGPFTDTHGAPFVCQPDEGGSIDPQAFADGGKLYLYWKNDGNCCGIMTYLYGQEMSADGLTLVGNPQRLTQREALWEGNLIEAPFMFKHNARYYMFFSANDYASEYYAVGYAACQSALGPCEQAKENPILKSRMTEPLVVGPGGQTLLQLGDQTWIFYHAWSISGGTRGDTRYMWLDRLDWPGDKPVVRGPTTDPQPAPPIGQ